MMAPRGRACMVVVVLLQVARLLPGAEGTQDDHGISLFNKLLQDDPSVLCQYVSCQEPLDAAHCPEGTLYMPHVGHLGCCGACIRFRQEGDQCTGSIDPKYGGGYGYVGPDGRSAPLVASVGGDLKPVDNVMDSQWCDYYLLCGEVSGRCETNPTVRGCLYTQSMYDQAVASDDFMEYRDDYRWRPDCTPDGDYSEKQCKGPVGEKRCVCVDPNGERLYGAAFPDQKELYETMNCKCSRRVWERLQEGESSVTLHCKENGNYEPLQCEDGWCYCIDPDTTIPYGSRLPEGVVDHLPCYNKTLLGEQYLRRCESQYHARMKLKDYMAFKGVMGPSTLLNCDPDGSYGSKQCDSDMCRCYDKYMVDAYYPAGRGCQCARDKWLFTANHVQVVLQCDVNTGAYAELQTRDLFVYCADEDGIRAGPLVYLEYKGYLACNSAKLCQTNGRQSDCDAACSECPPEAYPKYNGKAKRR